MPKNIDYPGRHRRRQEAIHSAAASTALMGLPALALLGLRSCMRIGGLSGAALLILALLKLEAIVPVWAALYERLKEIEGGEENDAAQY